MRSFEQNFEVNLLIYDEKVTIEMKEQMIHFAESSRVLTVEEYRASPTLDRVKEKLARLSSPLM